MILDSNIIIYAVLPDNERLRQWCFQQTIWVSEITRLEVLGYHKLNEPDRRDFVQLFALTRIYPVSSMIIDGAITLRQQRKMSLGDAIIAATALEYRQTLVTRNVNDFARIEGLKVVNPMEDE